jgi:exodeoxyribonuclease V alpha subunit
MERKISWNPQGCRALAGIIDGPIDLLADPEQESFLFQKDMLVQAAGLGLEVEQLYIAWEIARLAAGDLKTDQLRALQMIVLAALSATADGNTRLPLDPGGRLDRFLAGFSLNTPDRQAVTRILDTIKCSLAESADGHLFSVIGRPERYCPLIVDHDCLYLQKFHVLENRVGRMLRMMIDEQDQLDLVKAESDLIMMKQALEEVLLMPPEYGGNRIVLDDWQQQAVRIALNGRIAVVSGRPGSGKTSIVASLLRVLARIGDLPVETIALAAPTGKAADRMRQSIAGQLASIPGAGEADLKLAAYPPPATTLHRLLGFSPGAGRFWHNEQNPLNEKLIIVDECSMLDLAMSDHLLRALKPDSRLVLLGDADQLPPVEAGAVFSDLCRSRRVAEKRRVVRLEQSYRAREEEESGSRIISLALAINDGSYKAGLDHTPETVLRAEASDLAFSGAELLSPGNAEQRRDFFELWFNRFCQDLHDFDQLIMREYYQGYSGFDERATAELRILFDHFERYKILAVTRITAGGTGSDNINSWYHHRWFEKLRASDKKITLSSFLTGEPVIITHNDYLLRLFNGDSGIILQVGYDTDPGKSSVETMAVFPRGKGFVAYPLGTLRGRMDLAWATTVHKAQGSEYDWVALILPDTPVRPLTRELLYTAVTRARRSVVISGTAEILEKGTGLSVARDSGISEIIDA